MTEFLQCSSRSTRQSWRMFLQPSGFRSQGPPTRGRHHFVDKGGQPTAYRRGRVAELDVNCCIDGNPYSARMTRSAERRKWLSGQVRQSDRMGTRQTMPARIEDRRPSWRDGGRGTSALRNYPALKIDSTSNTSRLLMQASEATFDYWVLDIRAGPTTLMTQIPYRVE